MIALSLAFMCCSSSYITTRVCNKVTLSSRDAVHGQSAQFLRSLILSRDLASGAGYAGHCISQLRGGDAGDDSDDDLDDEDNEDKSQDDEVRISDVSICVNAMHVIQHDSWDLELELAGSVWTQCCPNFLIQCSISCVSLYGCRSSLKT